MSDTTTPDVAQSSFGTAIGFRFPERNRNVGASGNAGRAIKRGFDIVGSLTLIAVLLPVLPVLALIVRKDGGPALYRHPRVGRDGRIFGCLKYRSMATSADEILRLHLQSDPRAADQWAASRKLTNDPRITRFGALLRKTSLDEVPQLFNVLRGDMSLVGPRPAVQEELDQHYGTVGREAYASAKPGITGLWQVSGRSDTSYEQRVALDIAYARDWSLSMDLKILLRTVPAVLNRRGAV